MQGIWRDEKGVSLRGWLDIIDPQTNIGLGGKSLNIPG